MARKIRTFEGIHDSLKHKANRRRNPSDMQTRINIRKTLCRIRKHKVRDVYSRPDWLFAEECKHEYCRNTRTVDVIKSILMYDVNQSWTVDTDISKSELFRRKLIAMARHKAMDGEYGLASMRDRIQARLDYLIPTRDSLLSWGMRREHLPTLDMVYCVM